MATATPTPTTPATPTPAATSTAPQPTWQELVAQIADQVEFSVRQGDAIVASHLAMQKKIEEIEKDRSNHWQQTNALVDPKSVEAAVLALEKLAKTVETADANLKLLKP